MNVNKLKIVHLMGKKQATRVNNGEVKEEVSFCGKYTFMAGQTLGEVTFLLIEEYLFDRHDYLNTLAEDNELALFDEDEFKVVKSKLCPDCINHKDLPLYALKEFV